ncbi:MAG: hypothetical protein OEQ13_02895 [Acidobacteriota bacterium]|nr:hypothetical protein [Acidobacteriota bacterium]
MAETLPPWMLFEMELVQATGTLELGLAASLIAPRTRRAAEWIILALLVLFLPVNVSAAIRRVPMGGHAWGPVYLWVLVPLQAVLFAWTWWFVARSATSSG